MAFETELKVYQFQFFLGQKLLEGVSPETVATSTCEGGQHPAWIIGHLGYVANQVSSMFGGTPGIDMGAWKAQFDMGTDLSQSPSDYPAWDELVGVWEKGHADVTQLAPSASDEFLAQPTPYESMRPALPTMREFVGFVLTGHEAWHLGQLSAWRRTNGLPRLF